MSWSDSTALVTGAAGFIGSHLTERLLHEGARVKALVRYNSSQSDGWLRKVPERFRSRLELVYGDVCDAERIADVTRGCDVVFHLAALISIPYSYEAPEAFVETNVGGTLNVLLAARRFGGVRVIQTSTSEVYGTPRTVPITEDHPLQAQSPYAATKIAADQLALSFHRTYGLPVTVLRPFNTYGPRQSTRAVLPTILTQLLAGSGEVRLGALWPRRDLTFVSDTVDGFIKAAEYDAAVGETIQLGTGRDISVGELVELAARMLGVEAKVECDDSRIRPAQSEVQRLLSDPSVAARLLSWRPSVPLEAGLGRTAKWLRSNLGEYKVGQYVV